MGHDHHAGQEQRPFAQQGQQADPTNAAQIRPTQWLPGNHDVAATLFLPASLPAGRYTLGVALIDPLTEKPAIRLASDIPHKNRLHHVSHITVK